MSSSLHKSRRHNLFRARSDKIATVLITFGGWAILLMLGLMIWHLIKVAAPLAAQPNLSLEQPISFESSEQLAYMGDLLSGELAISLTDDCGLNVYQFNKKTAQLDKKQHLPFVCSSQIQLVSFHGQPVLFQLLSSGHLKVDYLRVEGQRIERKFIASILLKGAVDVTQGWRVAISDGQLMVGVRNQDDWHIYAIKRGVVDDIKELTVKSGDEILLMPELSQVLVAYPDRLTVSSLDDERVQIIEINSPVEYIKSSHQAHGFILGLSNGYIEKWLVINQDGRFVFHSTAQWLSGSKIQTYWQNEREHLGVLLNASGQIEVVNMVSGEQVNTLPLSEVPIFANLIEDRFYFQYEHKIEVHQLQNLSAAINFASLWKSLWYAGYEQPTYVWQSAAGEGIEPKYSLVPLVIGSIKSALYALLIAVPLSLGAAIYSSYFLSHTYRRIVKPTIELLEAVPSVVIGFLLSAWLISWSTQSIYILFVGAVLGPIGVIFWSFVQQRIARQTQIFKVKNKDLWLMFAIIFSGFCLAYFSWQVWFASSQHSVILTFFETNISAGKNTLVVAIALGIAITPTIYTLAEDAIHGVPMHYQQASYALGATQLQTLQKVVLKVALPGIVSAIMLGFGRAFGETMIVLMVTGNTPIADWGLFSGLRTLGANLAIELPHSEVGSGHYQVLFLTALLLFMFTFMINTVAELIRNRFYLRYDNV